MSILRLISYVRTYFSTHIVAVGLSKPISVT